MLFLHNILNSIWAIEPAYAANYLPILDAYLKGEQLHAQTIPKNEDITIRNGIQTAVIQSGTYVISEWGQARKPEDAPENSIAIVYITDAITKHDQWCGPAGMITKSDILNRCYANDNIKSVILVIESGGGEGMAMRMMNETLAKRNKPVGAFIDDFACSAAYGIASACDIVVANSPMARVGSIGTFITIADYTERYKQLGINLIDVYASASTDKNSEYIEAIKGNPAQLKKIANTFNDYFLSMIETNRTGKLSSGREVWGTGKVWFAEEAKQLGIIDGIDTLENFINYFNV